MTDLTFISWRRAKLLAQARLEAGRLAGSVPLVLRDTLSGQQIAENVALAFAAAGDVAGFEPGAIRHLAPKPDTGDAETTKLVHVDFVEPDLPWRYTPELAHGAKSERLRPWLVLLVGDEDELEVVAGIVTRCPPKLLEQHPLGDSHRWAHVQTLDGQAFSRLVSPKLLAPQRRYVAAIVPAFGVDGREAWTDGQKNFEPLPAFFSWRFSTGEEGDFETLAGALELRNAGDLGKVRVRYRRPVTAVDVVLEGRGAITSLQEPPDEHEALQAARQDLDRVNDPVPDEPVLPTRELMGLPAYGALWLADPDAAAWSKSLNDDPRHRGIAGIGAEMAVRAQEELMDAAVKQAGALEATARRLAHLACGLGAAERLWQRRLPAAAELQLRVFGPAMGRLLASGGGTVLERISGADSLLDAALFSSAAQRLLRNGTARARFGAAGHIDRAAVLQAANRPVPAPEPLAPGLPHVDVLAESFGERPYADALGLAPLDPEALENLLQEFDGQPNDAASAAAFARAANDSLGLDCANAIVSFLRTELSPLPRAFDRESLLGALERCLEGHLPERARETGLGLALPRPDTPDTRRPLNLDALAAALAGAIDPTQALPPARDRVSRSLVGPVIESLAAPEPPIGLDFPTWTLLKRHAPDWLLPGAGSVPPHSIVTLATNPTFVEAYLVGINTQFLAEMRWRNLPAPRVSTPLRMFWGYVNHGSGAREADISPIADWPSRAPGADGADDLGDLSHQSFRPGDVKGKSDLVIAFRTALFRRYPSTLVYLVQPPDDAALDELLKAPPDLSDAAAARADRRYFAPIFMAQLEPDFVFFIFDVDPDTLGSFWLVLDEPPSELRFRSDRGVPGGAPGDFALSLPGTDAAEFAAKNIDTPTRVAISGADLKKRAGVA